MQLPSSFNFKLWAKRLSLSLVLLAFSSLPLLVTSPALASTYGSGDYGSNDYQTSPSTSSTSSSSSAPTATATTPTATIPGATSTVTPTIITQRAATTPPTSTSHSALYISIFSGFIFLGLLLFIITALKHRKRGKNQAPPDILRPSS